MVLAPVEELCAALAQAFEAERELGYEINYRDQVQLLKGWLPLGLGDAASAAANRRRCHLSRNRRGEPRSPKPHL